MRFSWSRVRGRALGAAFVITSVSGIQLTGCLGHSASDVSSNFSESARKTAINAERELAMKKQDAAVAASTPAPQEESKIQLSSAETTVPSEKTEPTAPRRTSFIKRLIGRKSEIPQKDPFIEAAAAAPAKAQSEIKRAATTPDEALAKNATTTKAESSMTKAGPKSTTNPLRTAGTQSSVSERFSPYDDGPEARPFPSLDSLFDGNSNALADAGPFAAKAPEGALPAEQTPASTPATIETKPVVGKRVVGPKPPANWDPFAPEPTATQATAPKPATPAENFALKASPESQQKREKIRLLLAEARSHHDNDDLYSAYRCAMQAAQIAEQEKFEPGQGEESARDVSRRIAAEIWKSPESATSESFAMKNAGAEAGKSSPTPSAGEIFAPHDGFAEWTAASERESQASVQAASQQLPDLRQGLDRRLSQPQKSSQDPFQVPEVNLHTSLSPRTLDPFAENGTGADLSGAPLIESGVEFAIAHTLSTPSNSRSKEIWGKASPPPPVDDWMAQKPLAAAALDVNQPTLFVPSAPLPPLELDEPSYSWDRLTATDAAQPSKAERQNAESATSGRNIKWAFLGFVAAVISAVMGFRLARGEKPTPRPSEAALGAGEGEADSKRSLRIKRAA